MKKKFLILAAATSALTQVAFAQIDESAIKGTTSTTYIVGAEKGATTWTVTGKADDLMILFGPDGGTLNPPFPWLSFDLGSVRIGATLRLGYAATVSVLGAGQLPNGQFRVTLRMNRTPSFFILGTARVELRRNDGVRIDYDPIRIASEVF